MKLNLSTRRFFSRSASPETKLRPWLAEIFTGRTELGISEILEEAENFRAEGQWFEAELQYETAAKQAVEKGISPGARAVVAVMSGEFQEQMNRRPLAVEFYRAAALELTDAQPGLQNLKYLAHNNLGYLLKAEENYEAGEENYVAAANITLGLGKLATLDCSTVHNNLGALYHSAGYFDAAAQMHRSALEMLDGMGNAPREELVRTYRMLALAYLFQGNLAASLAALDGIRKLGWEQSGLSEERIIELLVTESSIRLDQRNLREAEVFALRAIEFCLEAQRGMAPLLPLLYTNLAGIYVYADHVQDAADLLQDAHLMRLSNLHCTDEELAISQQNMVMLASRLGDEDTVARHQRRLSSMGCPVQGDLADIQTMSLEELAGCLSIYRPAAVKPTKKNVLGQQPSGLLKLQRIGMFGKTMRVPKSRK